MNKIDLEVKIESLKNMKNKKKHITHQEKYQ